MTEEQFFAALPQTKKMFAWDVYDDQILGFPEKAKDRRSTTPHKWCPVTAVATLAFARVYRFTQPQLAAEHLGLDADFANRVCLASGGNPAHAPLRARLAKSLSLEVA